MTVSVTDFGFAIIPDRITLPGTALGLTLATLNPEHIFLEATMGAGLGFCLFYLLAWGGRAAFKREALGGGDIKLSTMLGAFLGWPGVLLALFTGAVLALAFVLARAIFGQVEMKQQVSLGPFLMCAGLIAYSLGDRIVDAYLQLIGAL